MSRTLVTYFSITGVTESAAIRLAHAIGADLFEIVPEKSGAEPGKPENSAPGISVFGKNLDDYDRIYVGLPIWWYAAPTVIHTFLSHFDLRGKTVIPFATSGAGGLDKVRPRLQDSCQGADLREASLLREDLTEKQMRDWASGF